jgi:hypothetical protein
MVSAFLRSAQVQCDILGTQLGNIERKKITIRSQHESLDKHITLAIHRGQARISLGVGNILVMRTVCDPRHG